MLFPSGQETLLHLCFVWPDEGVEVETSSYMLYGICSVRTWGCMGNAATVTTGTGQCHITTYLTWLRKT